MVDSTFKRFLVQIRRIAKKQNLKNGLRFVGYVFKRFGRDRGTRVAASLSYSSLLAIVPMMTIALALMSAFPGFQDSKGEIQASLLNNLLPSAELEIAEQLNSFVANANNMTAIGIVALAVTAIMLLYTISNSFNTIWRVQERRPIFNLILVYWALLTLGPLMLGASLTLSSYGFAVAQMADQSGYVSSALTAFIPIGLGCTAFTVLFLVVPNRPVLFFHALIGGMTTTTLFEILKSGFGLYLHYFPSYQAIYGALATIPIFLIWMYLSWMVVLLGAELTAALPERRAILRKDIKREGIGDRLSLILALLQKLEKAGKNGATLKETIMMKGLPADLQATGEALNGLKDMHITERTGRGRWVLCRDLATVSLGDLLRELDLNYAPKRNWPDGVESALKTLEDTPIDIRDKSLKEILQSVD
ncbi:YihY family inner membrane protein [Kiloniella sp.]|uniref:YihY family inner membrane protein n=1 Tax=Kiloniella sp. TaxID=1938587 RepID=UPI003B02BE28